MVYHRWGYFLSTEELVDTFKVCGGGIGSFNPRNHDDINHARRAIFLYLMPGRVRVWLATLDEEVGVVFFIGKPVPEIRKAVGNGLAGRCLDMFDRSPNPCRVVPNSLALKWTLYTPDRVPHELNLIEFLQSDSQGDRYPLTPEELALLPSHNRSPPPPIA